MRLTLFLLLASCSDYDLIEDKTIPGGGADSTPSLEPDIVVDPAALDFGALSPGEQGALVLAITNQGSADLSLNELLLADGGAGFAYTSPDTTNLAAGEETSLVVTWTAPDADAHEDQLLIGSNDPDEPQVVVPLAGAGLPPDIVLDPTWQDLGEVAVGLSASGTILVTNAGESDLHVEELILAHAEFSITDDGGLPGSILAPGESATLTLAFTPADAGPEEATLVVQSDDPDQPEAAATIEAEGILRTYAVQIELTADDRNEAWLDEVEITGANGVGWSATDTVDATLESGTHVLAVYATDTAAAIAGMIAAVRVDGTTTWLTGGGSWVQTPTNPGSGWAAVAYDDSAWTVPYPCSDTSPWGSSPADLLAEGARWVWWSSNCKALGEAWFRLEIVLP